MFGYSPTVNNTSGQILAAGTVGAAQTNADTQKQMGQDIGSVIKQFAGAYAENKALDAKAAAYGDFLNRHGRQLGFDPEWIKGFAKAPRDQQLAAGEMLTGQFGQQIGRMTYLNRSGEIYGGGGSGGGGGGGGGGGSYTVGKGWE
jgi:hypothetical protein